MRNLVKNNIAYTNVLSNSVTGTILSLQFCKNGVVRSAKYIILKKKRK